MKALRFLIGVLFAIAAGLSLIVLMLIGTGDGGELRLSEFRWDRTVLGILAAVTALTLVGALAMGLGSTAKSGWRSIWCLVPLALTVGFWFAPDTTAAAAVGVDRMVASPGFGKKSVGRSPQGIADVAWDWLVIAGDIALDWGIATIDVLAEWIEQARVWVEAQMAQDPPTN